VFVVVVVVVVTVRFTEGVAFGVIVPTVILPAGIPAFANPVTTEFILPRNKLFTAGIGVPANAPADTFTVTKELVVVVTVVVVGIPPALTPTIGAETVVVGTKPAAAVFKAACPGPVSCVGFVPATCPTIAPGGCL
jgi:hypothetical protein